MRKQILIAFATLILCFSVSAQTWHEIDSNTDRELKTIQFISNEIGFIGGDSILLKTIDGGETWNEISSDFSNLEWIESLDIYDLHFFDENHGYVMSGLFGAMLETFNGGETWTTIDVVNGFCQQTSLYFLDENYGFAGGAGCFEGHIIAEFENGTWTTAEDPESWNSDNYVTAINFKDESLGFAGTIEGTLLRTTDGGNIWDTIPNIAEGNPIKDIDFDGDLIRVAHHNLNEYGSMVSTDNGLTWEFDSDLASFFNPRFNALHTTEGGAAYAGGMLANNDFVNGIIFERLMFSWAQVPVEHSVNDIDSHSGTSVFAVGENGAIYTNQADIANTVAEIQLLELKAFPNPAAAGSFLNLELPGSESYTLVLENMTGASVLKVSSRAISGRSGINLDGISPGVYVLSVRSEDSQLKSKSLKIIIE